MPRGVVDALHAYYSAFVDDADLHYALPGELEAGHHGDPRFRVHGQHRVVVVGNRRVLAGLAQQHLHALLSVEQALDFQRAVGQVE